MVKLIFSCGFFLFLFSATLCLAANVKPCVVEKTLDLKRQTCKTSDKLISEKFLKIKPLPEVKTSDKLLPSINPSLKSNNTADTFESMIAPFLKIITPHFYDQIIKRDPKSRTA